MNPEPETYRERTRKRLQAIADDASSEPPMFAPIEMRATGLRAFAKLNVVWRCHPRLPDPDECEQAILGLLYSAGQLRYTQIVAALEVPEVGDGFSSATIERRLRKLVGLQIIHVSSETPRGYRLDPWLRGQADACANSA